MRLTGSVLSRFIAGLVNQVGRRGLDIATPTRASINERKDRVSIVVRLQRGFRGVLGSSDAHLKYNEKRLEASQG